MSPEICTCDLNDKSVGYQKDSEQSYYLKAYLRTQKTLHLDRIWNALVRHSDFKSMDIFYCVCSVCV